jgi:hypothetical protein
MHSERDETGIAKAEIYTDNTEGKQKKKWWKQEIMILEKYIRKIAIYVPMIYTVRCVMFLMRPAPLQRQVGGGWGLEIERFLGPVKWHRADRGMPFGAQKLEISRAQPPPTCQSNGSAGIKNHFVSGLKNHRCIGGLCTRAHG